MAGGDVSWARAAACAAARAVVRAAAHAAVRVVVRAVAHAAARGKVGGSLVHETFVKHTC